jgi:hypothetical protein
MLARVPLQEIHTETWGPEADMDPLQERKTETRLAVKKELKEKEKRATKAVKNMRKERVKRLQLGSEENGFDVGS